MRVFYNIILILATAFAMMMIILGFVLLLFLPGAEDVIYTLAASVGFIASGLLVSLSVIQLDKMKNPRQSWHSGEEK